MNTPSETSADSAQPEPTPGKTNYGVSAETFLRVYQAASSPQEVADLLGMPRPIIAARASAYRRKGLQVKRFPRGSKALDLEALSKLLEQIDREQEDKKDS